MNNLNLEQKKSDLEALFNKFNEASIKLEEKYAQLLNETEDLRRQLQIKTEEAKRCERLAALGETAAAIAHEIRNPLGAIKLFVSLLRTEIQGSVAGREYIDQIETSLIRLDGVITNILHCSKDQKLSFAPLNLHTIIVEQAKALSDAQVNLKLNANPFIIANDSGIRQVFVNLLNNAVQANASLNNKSKCQINISSTDVEEGVVVKIHNQGALIPEKLLSRLFEPFVTNKSTGTGLGLAIVKRIIDQHRANITVSNLSDGPQFEIKFLRKIRE